MLKNPLWLTNEIIVSSIPEQEAVLFKKYRIVVIRSERYDLLNRDTE